MKVFLSVLNNRVIGQGSKRGSASDVEFEVPEGHEVLRNPFIFKLEGNQLVKDEAYKQQLIQEQEDQKNKPSLEQRLNLLQQAIDSIILGGI
jgi:hypothetical protein